MEKSSISEIERKKRSLKRYKKNLACIDRLEDKLDLLNDRMTSIKSPNLSGMPRGGQPTTITDLVADKVELEERIAALKLKSRRLRKETLEEIDRLDDPKHVKVLEMFFIDRLTLEEIAAELNYSNRHVYRIYSESLEYLADTPEESEDECQ